MKSFNKMTEMQMGQQSGGCIVCVALCFIPFMLGLTVSYQASKEITNATKQ